MHDDHIEEPWPDYPLLTEVRKSGAAGLCFSSGAIFELWVAPILTEGKCEADDLRALETGPFLEETIA